MPEPGKGCLAEREHAAVGATGASTVALRTAPYRPTGLHEPVLPVRPAETRRVAEAEDATVRLRTSQ
jgi:hypothetical protein